MKEKLLQFSISKIFIVTGVKLMSWSENLKFMKRIAIEVVLGRM